VDFFAFYIPPREGLDKDVIFVHPGFLGGAIKFVQEREWKCGGEEPVRLGPPFAWMVFDGAHVR
jgi:hypothetical protein